MVAGKSESFFLSFFIEEFAGEEFVFREVLDEVEQERTHFRRISGIASAGIEFVQGLGEIGRASCRERV